MPRAKRYYVKFFGGEEAFSLGLQELQAHCKLADTSIKSALAKTVGLDVLQHFIQETWPKVSFEKVLVCSLAMQALLTPARFSEVSCYTAHDGLIYRTGSGSLFGWRRLKDGTYIFMVMPGAFLRTESAQAVAKSLVDNKWKIKDYTVFSREMWQAVSKMVIEPTAKKPHEQVDCETVQ